jgi:hypothetical protein
VLTKKRKLKEAAPDVLLDYVLIVHGEGDILLILRRRVAI